MLFSTPVLKDLGHYWEKRDGVVIFQVVSTLELAFLNCVTAAQERLDMRSGCRAAKILLVGVSGTKNI